MAGSKKKSKDEEEIQSICRNKRAFHEYEIFETLECGIVLTGTEVKSLREHAANLEDAFARIDGGELWLVGSDIPEYTMGNRLNHKPKRPRKLLLHSAKSKNSRQHAQGYTLIPLRMYFKNGRAKVEIAVARGKKQYDKRETQKKADAAKEIRKAMKDRRR